jgi:hypothetical protein
VTERNRPGFEHKAGIMGILLAGGELPQPPHRPLEPV